MRIRVLMVAVAFVGLAACEEDTTEPGPMVTYTATLNGASERPNPVTTNGSGTWTGVLDVSTNVMTYTATWTGLGTVSNNAHIHGPTPATGNGTAGVIVDFNAPSAGRTISHGTSGSASGTINFNDNLTPAVTGDSLKKLLDAGRAYVNVHTTANTGGEILGIIMKKP